MKIYFAIVLWVFAIVAMLGFIVIAPWWAIFGAASFGLANLAAGLTKRGDGNVL